MQVLNLFGESILRPADNRLLPRTAHQNPLDQGLTADGGLKSAACDFFMFSSHSFLQSKGIYKLSLAVCDTGCIPASSVILCFSPWGLKHQGLVLMGRERMTMHPPPSALRMSIFPLWRVMISSQTARPMPVPRFFELPL